MAPSAWLSRFGGMRWTMAAISGNAWPCIKAFNDERSAFLSAIQQTAFSDIRFGRPPNPSGPRLRCTGRLRAHEAFQERCSKARSHCNQGDQIVSRRLPELYIVCHCRIVASLQRIVSRIHPDQNMRKPSSFSRRAAIRRKLFERALRMSHEIRGSQLHPCCGAHAVSWWALYRQFLFQETDDPSGTGPWPRSIVVSTNKVTDGESPGELSAGIATKPKAHATPSRDARSQARSTNLSNAASSSAVNSKSAGMTPLARLAGISRYVVAG